MYIPCMNKLLAQPVVAAFFFIFGVVLLQVGYRYLEYRYSPYTALRGSPTHIGSQAINPIMYWPATAAFLTIGGLCLVVSAYAAFRFLRALSASAPRFPHQAFGGALLVLGLIGMILASLLYTCSHR